MKKILKICVVILLLYLCISFYGNYKKKKMLEDLNQSVMENEADSIISSVELAHVSAVISCSETQDTFSIEAVKKEFSGKGMQWNDNNTITSQLSSHDGLVCNVIINSNNEMTVECDVNGVKINSEPLSMSCDAYKN